MIANAHPEPTVLRLDRRAVLVERGVVHHRDNQRGGGCLLAELRSSLAFRELGDEFEQRRIGPEGEVDRLRVADPPLDSVQATITAGDTSVVVVKGVLIADLPSANPAVTALMVDGDAADDGLTIDAGATYPLELATDPAPGDDATFAWYSTVGEIALYQSNPTELVAGDAGDGWLFVVMRDGRGGVAWRGVSVEVR